MGAGVLVALMASAAFGQSRAFDVASVKAGQRQVGPDGNRRFAFEAGGITARNVTLKRLVAEAYRLQMAQVLGPGWLDQNEYDIDAKAAGAVAREQMALMLRAMLAERFKLVQHRETKEMRLYEMVVDKGGPKIQTVKDGEVRSGMGGRFHGELPQLADLIAVQLSIAVSDDPSRPGRASGNPALVLDKTGLSGVFDFPLDFRADPSMDMLSRWQRILQDQLGLRLNSRRGEVEVLVVDGAEKVPTAN